VTSRPPRICRQSPPALRAGTSARKAMGYRVGGPGNGTIGGGSPSASARGGGEADERFTTSYSGCFSNAAARKQLGLSASASAGALRGRLGGGGGIGANPMQLAAARTIAPGHVPVPMSAVNSARSTSSVARLPPAFGASARADLNASASFASVAEEGASPMTTRKIDPEMRRRTLELLADPDLEAVAQDIFRAHDVDHGGKLQLSELLDVLKTASRELDIASVDTAMAESLFKNFDVNDDKSLAFGEFMELFRTLLRRSAFDRSTVLRREFFINKVQESVWNVFERKKELGTGTFGTAYLAKRNDTGELRVVKQVQKSRTRMPLDDIEQEILIMRQVDHPHIVRLFQWYEDAGHLYLVLEALVGGTLKEVLMEMQKKNKGLKEDWIRKVIHQSCGGMAYCHSLRLVHKDLKDENIMLLRKDPEFEEPFAVIIDLGIAEMFSVADPTGRKTSHAASERGGRGSAAPPRRWPQKFGGAPSARSATSGPWASSSTSSCRVPTPSWRPPSPRAPGRSCTSGGRSGQR